MAKFARAWDRIRQGRLWLRGRGGRRSRGPLLLVFGAAPQPVPHDPGDNVGYETILYGGSCLAECVTLIDILPSKVEAVAPVYRHFFPESQTSIFRRLENEIHANFDFTKWILESPQLSCSL